MIAPALLVDLAALDIRLVMEDGRLVIDAPAGAMTPALREQIASNKLALLALLAAVPTPESPQDAPDGPVASNGQPQPASTGTGHPADDRGSPLTLAPLLPHSEPPERGMPLPKKETMDGKPGDAPLSLWLNDRLYLTPGIAPLPAPPDLSDEQISAQVAAARVLGAPASATAGAAARGDQERQARRHGTPPEVLPPELVARILAAGERLGWPVLALRPGERLAAGEDSWQKFAAHGPASRLRDAARGLQP